MKVLIATDSFKGSLSSTEAAKAIRDGIKLADKKTDVEISPVADGGEGTVDALVETLDGTYEYVKVSDPLGKIVNAKYGVIRDICIIETAEASGLPLLNEYERNPLYTTTFGTGEIILDALNKGFKKFIIGIGGSATNDGGVGCLQALGFSFKDKNGMEISHGAIGLENLKSISLQNADKRLYDCKFKIACDVKNPLCGENGCSKIFAPQKGADENAILKMDKWLKNFAFLSKKIIPESDKDFPGSGAAGGLGFALKYYLNAELDSGFEIIQKAVNLEEKIKAADIVITGEGKIDGQSLMGKVPVGVAKKAKKYKKPVVALCGQTGKKIDMLKNHGIDAVFSILSEPVAIDKALEKKYTEINLQNTAFQVFSLIAALKSE